MIVNIQTQSAFSASNASSLTLTWLGNTSNNDTIVLCITKSHTMTISSINDSQGNTYTLAGPTKQVGGSANVDVSLYYCIGILGGTTPTITINLSSTGNEIVAIAREYQGILLPDAFKTSSGTGTAVTSTASAATAQSYELVVGFMGASWNAGDTITIGSGFKNMTAVNDVSFMQGAIEENIITSNNTQTATFTITTETWAAGVMTFTGIRPSFRAQSIRPHPFSPGLAR